MNNSQSETRALEIGLERPPGRNVVFLRTSVDHPGMLVVIGLGGLPHGSLIGVNGENRARLRQWLDAQDSSPKTTEEDSQPGQI